MNIDENGETEKASTSTVNHGPKIVDGTTMNNVLGWYILPAGSAELTNTTANLALLRAVNINQPSFIVANSVNLQSTSTVDLPPLKKATVKLQKLSNFPTVGNSSCSEGEEQTNEHSSSSERLSCSKVQPVHVSFNDSTKKILHNPNKLESVEDSTNLDKRDTADEILSTSQANSVHSSLDGSSDKILYSAAATVGCVKSCLSQVQKKDSHIKNLSEALESLGKLSTQRSLGGSANKILHGSITLESIKDSLPQVQKKVSQVKNFSKALEGLNKSSEEARDIGSSKDKSKALLAGRSMPRCGVDLSKTVLADSSDEQRSVISTDGSSRLKESGRTNQESMAIMSNDEDSLDSSTSDIESSFVDIGSRISVSPHDQFSNSSGGSTPKSGVFSTTSQLTTPEKSLMVPPEVVLCFWCKKVRGPTVSPSAGTHPEQPTDTHVGSLSNIFPLVDGERRFCSEVCFTQSRRASFKKAKVCDWCRQVQPTVSYADFTDGNHQLQFCSTKCSSQYKMHIFCRETEAHLQLHPHLNDLKKNTSDLITPDLWLKESSERETGERKPGMKNKIQSPLKALNGHNEVSGVDISCGFAYSSLPGGTNHHNNTKVLFQESTCGNSCATLAEPCSTERSRSSPVSSPESQFSQDSSEPVNLSLGADTNPLHKNSKRFEKNVLPAASDAAKTFRTLVESQDSNDNPHYEASQKLKKLMELNCLEQNAISETKTKIKPKELIGSKALSQNGGSGTTHATAGLSLSTTSTSAQRCAIRVRQLESLEKRKEDAEPANLATMDTYILRTKVL